MYLLIAFTCLLVYVIYWCMRPHYFSELRFLPEPPRWPIIQYNWDMMFAYDTYKCCARWAQTYNGLYKLNFMNPFKGGYMVVVANVQHVKDVLGKTSLFKKDKFFQTLFPLMGEGVLCSNGKQHAFQRRLMAKAFSPDHIRKFTPIMNSHANRLIEVLKKEIGNGKEGKNVQVQSHLSNTVFDVFCDTALGHHYDALTSESEFVSIMKRQIDTLANLKIQMLLVIFKFLFIDKLMDKFIFSEKNKDRVKLEEILDDIIKKKKKVLATDEEGERHNDLLSMMIRARDEDTNAGFTDKLLRDNVFTLMVASFETTGTAIPWVLYSLAMNIDKQDLARQEIIELMGDGDIDEEGMMKLSYTTACIKETLRLHTVAPATDRVAKQDVDIGGHKIKAGTSMFVSLLGVHHQKDIYKDPEQYVPERFLDTTNMPLGSFVAFGHGPYNCIGRYFAMMEIKIILCHILKNFYVSADSDFQKYKRNALITATTDRPITLRLVPIRR